MSRTYNRYSEEDKMRLIMECRQSGLSDHQWCCENNVSNSTFYNWIKKLRDTACNEEIVEPSPIRDVKPIRQDVVKVNIVPDHNLSPAINSSNSSFEENTAAIELNLNGCNIKIHNNVNPVLLAHTINLLRGSLC